jgi:hypothetical protein
MDLLILRLIRIFLYFIIFQFAGFHINVPFFFFWIVNSNNLRSYAINKRQTLNVLFLYSVLFQGSKTDMRRKSRVAMRKMPLIEKNMSVPLLRR